MEGWGNFFLSSALWSILGPLYLLKINLEDTCVFFNILCFEKSVSFNHEEEEKKKMIQHKFYIYRDSIRAMKQLMYVADDSSIVLERK